MKAVPKLLIASVLMLGVALPGSAQANPAALAAAAIKSMAKRMITKTIQSKFRQRLYRTARQRIQRRMFRTMRRMRQRNMQRKQRHQAVAFKRLQRQSRRRYKTANARSVSVIDGGFGHNRTTGKTKFVREWRKLWRHFRGTSGANRRGNFGSNPFRR